MHKDPEFESIEQEIEVLKLPYKRKNGGKVISEYKGDVD